jgi:hypothetical protein
MDEYNTFTLVGYHSEFSKFVLTIVKSKFPYNFVATSVAAWSKA